jgi:phospholipid-binding lipoprotein MlaA
MKQRVYRNLIGRALLCSILLIAIPGANAEESADVRMDELADDEVPTLEVDDPIESVNRGVFWFNDTLDVYLLEPIARGYDYVVPDRAQESVGNFFDTLRYPIYLFSNLVSADFDRAWEDSARFGINATIGCLGLFDVAEDFGFERQATDAGVAFGRLGISEGPYIVLPVLGPSNARDAIGEIFNFALDPFAAVQFTQIASNTQTAISTGVGVGRTINRRSQMLSNVKSAKEASLDYYLFVQSAYAQYRRGLIRGETSEDRALFDTRVE